MGSRKAKARTVFLSYSHDSTAHRRRVLALSDRLREAGIDARVDQYLHGSPPEGWPPWMFNQIDQADFVLVVCTETYQLRALGREQPGRGRGATWEGAIITQALYSAQARNSKFVPVVLRSGDDEFIPYFLAGATYYDVRLKRGFDALLSYLTGQHDTPMPPLGPRPASTSARPVKVSPQRAIPSTRAAVRSSSSSRTPTATTRATRNPTGEGTDPVLLYYPNGHSDTLWAPRIAAGEDLAVSVLAKPGDTPRLEALQAAVGRGQVVGIAYGTRALWARATDVRHELSGGQEVWHLTFRPERNAGQGVMDEMSTTGYSADDIAVLRARRILLDEPLPGRPAYLTRSTSWGGGADGMLESLVTGYGNFKVEGSPLPRLYATASSKGEAFLAEARLTLVLWLVLSNTVETVTRLDVKTKTVKGKVTLSIAFSGTRPQHYHNVVPTRIEVEGVCALTLGTTI